MTTAAAHLWTAVASVLLATALVGVTACGEGTTRPPPGAGGDDLCHDARYSVTIQPLFDQYCRQCHRAGVDSGGLDLESHAGTLGGGLSGAAVVPGDCEGSLLFQMVAHEAQPFMPPSESISAGDVDCICTWIDAGALDD